MSDPIDGLLHQKRHRTMRELVRAFPQMVGEFRRGEAINNERSHPGLGYTIAYHLPSLAKAAVLIYDLGREEIPCGPDGPIVLTEFERVISDVFAVAGSIGGPPVALIDRYGTGSPERGREFLCAEFTTALADTHQRSFLYLTGAALCFVKLRVTLVGQAETLLAREFADGAAAVLRESRQLLSSAEPTDMMS